AGTANLNRLGFAAGSQVYYSYAVRPSGSLPTSNAAITSVGSAAQALCVDGNTDNPTAAAPGTMYGAAVAYGDLNANGVISSFYRLLGTSADAGIPEASSLIIVNELE